MGVVLYVKDYLNTPKKMLRISQNSRVRRRLFQIDDQVEEARVDNFANVLQESITRDRIEKTRKWNFDFKNEVPLEGNYEWHRATDTSDWVGVNSEKGCDANEESCLPMKSENEATPKNREEEAVPLVRKRRRNAQKTDKAVRRKISFD